MEFQSRNKIDFVTIASTGDATDFGDLTEKWWFGAFLIKLEESFGGGYGTQSNRNVMMIISQLHQQEMQDFGDLLYGDQTIICIMFKFRGIVAGGNTGFHNIMLFNILQFQLTGNAQDFGDLTQARELLVEHSNSTRGLFGWRRTPVDTKIIDFITIASTGNAQDFGDLTQARVGCEIMMHLQLEQFWWWRNQSKC